MKKQGVAQPATGGVRQAPTGIEGLDEPIFGDLPCAQATSVCSSPPSPRGKKMGQAT